MSKVTKSDTIKKAMIKALENSLGIVSPACQQVGISRQTHYRWLEEDPDYKEECTILKNAAIDYAETKLFENIRDNKEASIMFYLKTQAKVRGYNERLELDTGTNNAFRVIIKDEGHRD